MQQTQNESQTDQHDPESQLESMRRALAQKDKELEQFIYTASHDLKSPLVAINGYIAQLRRDIERQRFDRLPELSDWIVDVVHRMNRNIDDLLELSRVGRSVQPPTEVDVVAVCEEVIEAHKQRIEEGGIDISVDQSIPRIHGDEARVRQMFTQLVDNALTFAGSTDKPVIRITGKNESNGTIICVSDNGHGIAAKHHERIFELFQRLDSHKSGSGIGLTLVRRIAETHHGRAWVESEPGKGATFYIFWPNKH